jgi:hypothetical protein
MMIIHRLTLIQFSHQKDWKVGAYEPTTAIHGDIEHLYVLDLSAKEIREIKIPNMDEDWSKMKTIKTWKK